MKWLFPTDICLVTGGNSGLGAEILKEFARQGCQTVSLDIKPPPNLDLPYSVEHEDNNIDSSVAITDPAAAPAIEKCALNACNARAHDAISVHEEAITLQKALPVSDVSNVQGDFRATDDTSMSASALEQIRKGSGAPSQEDQVGDDVAELAISVNEEAPTVTPAEEQPAEDLTPTLFIPCDVRSQVQLQEARDLIFKKFNRYPSVIVLNAAIRRPLHSILDSDFADLEDTLDVNLGGFVKCLRTFLPDMVQSQRGFVVSVASALGFVIPKGLGAYGASKSGVIGIHEALEQELGDHQGVHALLVCPGQLDTAMFSDVKTPSTLLAPVVSPTKLAQKIVKRIAKAKTSTLYAPNYVRYLPLMRAVPVPLANLTRKFAGVDKVYDDIVAERKKMAKMPEGNEIAWHGASSDDVNEKTKKAPEATDESVKHSIADPSTEQLSREISSVSELPANVEGRDLANSDSNNRE